MLRKATVIAAMLATTTAVAACGSTPKNTKGSSTPRSDIGLKLAQCMRSHGVPSFPDPGSGGGFQVQQSSSSKGSGGTSSINVDGRTLDASAPAFRRAMNQCQKDLPQGPPISGSQLAKIKQGALKMAECMRSHGVPNFPDPQVTVGPGGHGIAIRMGLGDAGGSQAQRPSGSPAFQHAMNICQPLMNVGLKRQKVS